MTKIGLILVTLFILAGLFAPFLITHDPKSTDISHRFSPPSHTHWLGQDKLGGDIYSKIIYGARISLTVAIVSTLLSFFIVLLLKFMSS